MRGSNGGDFEDDIDSDSIRVKYYFDIKNRHKSTSKLDENTDKKSAKKKLQIPKRLDLSSIRAKAKVNVLELNDEAVPKLEESSELSDVETPVRRRSELHLLITILMND